MFWRVDLGRLCAQPCPSARDTFPLAISGYLQRRTKGALAADCTLTLKSASKKHQKLYTSVSEHREWHSEGGQKNCVLCIFSPSSKQPFSSPLCVASRLDQAIRVYSGKICQKSEPRFQHSRFYLNDSSI